MMKRIFFIFLCLAAAQARADITSLLTPIEDLKPSAGERSSPKDGASVKLQEDTSTSKAVRVSAEDVLAALAKSLLRQFGADGELQLTLLQDWTGPLVEHQAWEVELMRLPQQGLTSRMVLPIRINCGDQSTEHQLVVNCRLFREVLVPARKINRGESLTPEDFEVLVRDVLASHSPLVAASEPIENYESKQSLMPGKLLSWRDIQEKPLIKRGQVVEVVAEEGFMRISVKGEALQDGKAGDFISVRNLTTRKNLQARILNEQVVQVLF